jgi:hypothetical protein
MTDEHKYTKGQHVRYSHINVGHDSDWLKSKGAKITRVFQGKCPSTTSYSLEGSPSIHPETRLTHK